MGVRVLSVTQEFMEAPMGTLMEGFFECIDQYESELNGLRTSAAMREAIKQYYPGGRTPYGFARCPSKCARGSSLGTSWRSIRAKQRIIHTMYRLYVTGSGAVKVAGH